LIRTGLGVSQKRVFDHNVDPPAIAAESIGLHPTAVQNDKPRSNRDIAAVATVWHRAPRFGREGTLTQIDQLSLQRDVATLGSDGFSRDLAIGTKEVSGRNHQVSRVPHSFTVGRDEGSFSQLDGRGLENDVTAYTLTSGTAGERAWPIFCKPPRNGEGLHGGDPNGPARSRTFVGTGVNQCPFHETHNRG
jgi:hypothetical protein